VVALREFISFGDDSLRPPSVNAGMTTRTWRVLLNVEPAVFADVLSRLLVRSDLQVVRPGDHLFEAGGAALDVVVTTGMLPPEIRAATVIKLPDASGDQGDATVTTEQGSRLVPLHDIDDLVALIDELCPTGGGPARRPSL
jgi:hypothetical protein